MILNETYTLENGLSIPKLGLGTWFIDDDQAAEAVRTAVRLVRKYGTRNADHLAEALGLIVMPRAFKHQKGVYKVIERNRYILSLIHI